MRNIILITGGIADGKTTLISGLMSEFENRHIPFTPKPITDSDFIMDAVRWDDASFQGVYHMHEGQEAPSHHRHESLYDGSDFVVTGYRLQRFVFSRLFSQLSLYPENSRYLFTELTAGVSRYPDGHPAQKVDYSYESIVQELTRVGGYEIGWVNRIAAVIHPSSTYDQRMLWNERRLASPPEGKQVRAGFASRPVPDAVMPNTMEDDFRFFENFLVRNARISSQNILTIPNDGTDRLVTETMRWLAGAGIVREGELTRKEKR